MKWEEIKWTVQRWVYSPPRRRGFLAGVVVGAVLGVVGSCAFRRPSATDRLAERGLQQLENVREMQRAYGVDPDRPYDGFLPKAKGR